MWSQHPDKVIETRKVDVLMQKKKTPLRETYEYKVDSKVTKQLKQLNRAIEKSPLGERHFRQQAHNIRLG